DPQTSYLINIQFYEVKEMDTRQQILLKLQFLQEKLELDKDDCKFKNMSDVALLDALFVCINQCEKRNNLPDVKLKLQSFNRRYVDGIIHSLGYNKDNIDNNHKIVNEIYWE